MPDQGETGDDGVDWFEDDNSESDSKAEASGGDAEEIEWSEQDSPSAGSDAAGGVGGGDAVSAPDKADPASAAEKMAADSSSPAESDGTAAPAEQASPCAPEKSDAEAETLKGSDQKASNNGMRHRRAIFAIPVELTVCVGKARPMIGDLLKMRRDALLPLDTRISDPLEIRVRNRVIARGELQKLSDASDQLAVRVTQIADISDAL